MEYSAHITNIYISREISIEYPSAGLASLAQLEIDRLQIEVMEE